MSSVLPLFTGSGPDEDEGRAPGVLLDASHPDRVYDHTASVGGRDQFFAGLKRIGFDP